MAYALTKLICFLLFRLRHGFLVTGQEHVPRRGPFILATNHVSFIDPPVIGTACPRRVYFLARADLFRHPLLAAFMRSVGVIPLRRGAADVGAMRAALGHLRRGLPIAMFPEGTRQLSGRLGAAKRGVGVLADLAHVPVVPAYIDGTFQVLPPATSRLQPGKIRIAFGPPIPYTEPSLSDRAERRQALAEAVTASWRQLEAQMRTPASTPST